MVFGKPPVPRRGKGGFSVFMRIFIFAAVLAMSALLAGKATSAVTMSAGAVAYEIYGISGAHEVVRGQFISAGWKVGQEMTVGFIYENGLAFSGTGAAFADYGLLFEKNLPGGLGIGVRLSQVTVRAGGTLLFQERIFGLHGRVPIKQFSTASLGVMVGFIFAPNTPVGSEVAPRIALVGSR
jgi:hypothetical protein